MNFEKYRLRKGLILAFHGCDLAVAEEVATGRTSLRRSENTYDWLGHGIYFWENNPERALEWAEAAAKRGRIQSPAVIGAILDLGHCLDLTETVGCEEVAKTYDLYHSESSLSCLSRSDPGSPGVPPLVCARREATV